MEQQIEHTKRILGKLQLVVKEISGLRRENAALSRQIEEWKEKYSRQSETIHELTQQAELLKLNSPAGWEDETKQAFEKRLQQYIKEIDRCLEMLND